MHRNYPSGAQKRSSALEKKNRETEISEKTPKLTSFFKPQTTTRKYVEQASASKTVTEVRTASFKPVVDDVVVDDLHLWPDYITESLRNYWIQRGASSCQHKDNGFKESVVQLENEPYRRYCTLAMFTRVHARTGEQFGRNWLCYSKTSGRVYCFTCKLMSPMRSKLTRGFNDWKHANKLLSNHENCKQHLDAMAALCARKSSRHIDSDLVEQYESEIQYWKQVLRRIVSVVQFLCIRGLAFRGKSELIGSSKNGNYLGILELLSEYDTFLAAHIRKHANKGRGHTSYLSSTICEEVIELMGQTVLSVIVNEIKLAKYFSISVDSTPDVMHVDQLTVIVRYVLQSGPIERFIKFIPMFSHSGYEIAQIMLHFLEENGINIEDCRGQSYDNAANMSGKYNGVQAKLLEKCSVAHYVPCTAHSLNLVGKGAAESCPTAAEFFGLLQSLYSWLVSSTHRWQVHRKHLKGLPVNKALSDTRWSARYDAVRAIKKGYNENISALEELATDENLPRDSRLEAEGFLKKLQQLEVAILLEIWDAVLERFQKTSLCLQESGLSLNSAVHLLKSLLEFIKSQRSEFQCYEEKGMMMSAVKEYKESSKRPKKRKRQFDEDPSAERVLSPREKFKVDVFLIIIDKLSSALQHRLDAYKEIQGKFGFFTNLTELSDDGIRFAAKKLLEEYSNDFEDCFPSELIQFTEFFKTVSAKENKEAQSATRNTSTELKMLLLLNESKCVQTFPNVYIALRIYLSMMSSNCSGERSFSKLKRIKNEVRSCMGQQRLSLLSLMSIEHEILHSLNFTDLIDNFALRKARRHTM